MLRKSYYSVGEYPHAQPINFRINSNGNVSQIPSEKSSTIMESILRYVSIPFLPHQNHVTEEFVSDYYNEFKSNIEKLYELFPDNLRSFDIIRHDGNAKYKLSIIENGSSINAMNLAGVVVDDKLEISAKYISKLYYNIFVAITETILNDFEFKPIALNAYKEDSLSHRNANVDDYKNIIDQATQIKNSKVVENQNVESNKYRDIVKNSDSISIDLTQWK